VRIGMGSGLVTLPEHVEEKLNAKVNRVTSSPETLKLTGVPCSVTPVLLPQRCAAYSRGFLVGCVQQPDQLRRAPHVRGDAGFHRGRHAERLMHAAEVVVHEVEGCRCRVVLNLLAEGVGQAREPAHVHPHREVLAFNEEVLMYFGWGCLLSPPWCC
jgi:hypothetical protein